MILLTHGVCVCVCTRLPVCMCLCVYVWVSGWESEWECVHVWVSEWEIERSHVCVRACASVSECEWVSDDGDTHLHAFHSTFFLGWSQPSRVLMRTWRAYTHAVTERKSHFRKPYRRRGLSTWNVSAIFLYTHTHTHSHIHTLHIHVHIHIHITYTYTFSYTNTYKSQTHKQTHSHTHICIYNICLIIVAKCIPTYSEYLYYVCVCFDIYIYMCVCVFDMYIYYRFLTLFHHLTHTNAQNKDVIPTYSEYSYNVCVCIHIYIYYRFLTFCTF